MQIRQRETLSHQRTLPPWSLFIISSIATSKRISTYLDLKTKRQQKLGCVFLPTWRVNIPISDNWIFYNMYLHIHCICRGLIIRWFSYLRIRTSDIGRQLFNIQSLEHKFWPYFELLKKITVKYTSGLGGPRNWANNYVFCMFYNMRK